MDTRLPVEILIEIFFHSTPPDLYSLTLVCKKFRSLLWSTTSKTTQRIWRRSRLNYYPIIDIQPPTLRAASSERMSEQQYLWLMILCKKCQFCNQTDQRELNTYWEGKVYCCDRCLNERVISGEKLKTKWKASEDFLLCLTELPESYDTVCWQPQRFFISEVKSLSKECEQLKRHEINEINDWVERRKSEVIKLKKVNEKYRKLYDLCRHDYLDRARRQIHRRNRYYGLS